MAAIGRTYLHVSFLTMSALFAAWFSGMSIIIVVFPALMVLGSEILVSETLDPADRLPLKVFKAREPG
jgi:hypothetical protein